MSWPSPGPWLQRSSPPCSNPSGRRAVPRVLRSGAATAAPTRAIARRTTRDRHTAGRSAIQVLNREDPQSDDPSKCDLGYFRRSPGKFCRSRNFHRRSLLPRCPAASKGETPAVPTASEPLAWDRSSSRCPACQRLNQGPRRCRALIDVFGGSGERQPDERGLPASCRSRSRGDRQSGVGQQCSRRTAVSRR